MPAKPKKPIAIVLSTYELMQKFPDEQAAIDYLEGILWADGIKCPYCEGKDITPRASIPNFRKSKSRSENKMQNTQPLHKIRNAGRRSIERFSWCVSQVCAIVEGEIAILLVAFDTRSEISCRA
jgi:hypothetical protein